MQTPDNNRPKMPMQKSRIGIWYALTAGLILLFLFLFVFNFNSTPATKYADPDLTYQKDSSGNIIKKGDLLVILEEKEVKYLNLEIHDNAKYYYLEGQYNEINESNKVVKKYFIATFSSENEEAKSNFYTAINTRVGINSKGEEVKYYSQNGLASFAIVDYTSKVSIWSYLPTILLWAVIIGLGIFMVSRLTKSVGAANSQQFNFNSSRARRELNSKVKFKDVAGCDEVKAELVEMVDYFKNAKKYTRLGAKLPKGVLLVGPPGTGKTLLAKAVAGEAGVPFYSISGSDFVEMYVGVGAGRVRDMFKVAKQNAPCLIFIDEIDAVGRQRGAGLGGGNDEREQTLNQLLVEMDGFEDNSGVIVMAATNRADVLDPALLRAGRFDRQITVDLPDKDGREAMLKVHARNKIIDSAVDFGAIAQRTVGFSGADLANILNDAAILAVRANREKIIMADIDEAIDRSIAGPAKSNRTITQEEKRRIAFHESGHAIIGLKLPHSDKVQKITIIPRGRTGGHVLMTPENDRFVLTKSELLARITGFLGGRTSEEIFFGDVSTGASNDIERATEIAREMVTEYGMSELGPIQYEKNSGSVFLGRDYSSQKANYSTQIAFEIDKEVRKIVDSCHEEARKLIEKYRKETELIANTLIEKETITAEQIDYLLEHGELPKVEETKVEDTPVATSNTEEKVEEKEEPKKYDSEALKVISELEESKKVTNLLCLFLESDDGKDITYRTAMKIIKDSTTSYAARMIGMGEALSSKLNTSSTMLIRKEIWKQFKDSETEFGQYIEDTYGLEVVLVNVNHDSYVKLRESMEKRRQNTSSKKNKEASSLANDLKDLVSKDDDKKE